MRIIVGLTGATGAIYGIRLLERLRDAGVETHVVVSRWGLRTLAHETTYTRDQVEALASVWYAPGDMGAAISSGSFATDGMVVAPCSVKTLAAIAHGYGDSLIHRAADVVLKERRRLVLVVREAPLSDIHLENMLRASRAGAVILPPVPAFYNHPLSVADIVEHTVDRMLDQIGVPIPESRRWVGEMSAGVSVSREASRNAASRSAGGEAGRDATQGAGRDVRSGARGDARGDAGPDD